MKKETKLYNGEVTLLFDSILHKYIWLEKGMPVPSVTTSLGIIDKPALKYWAANVAGDYVGESLTPGRSYDELEIARIVNGAKRAHVDTLKDAGDLGTLLHNWIEDYINGTPQGIPVNPTLRHSIGQFLDWVNSHDIKFVLSEQPVMSRKHVYCGTLDFICYINGELYIGDFKTSKGIYTEMMIQTAAYRYARTEEFPQETYAGQIIIRLGKDGTFEVNVIRGEQTYNNMVKAFLYAHNLKKTLVEVEKFKPARRV